MMVRILCSLILCLMSAITFAQVNDSSVKIKWAYKGNIGPERWAQLSPDFALCATGKLQSPVNIMRKVKIADHKLAINYQPAPLIIIDDGTTPLTIGTKQTIIDDGHGIQINFHGDNAAKETIDYAGSTYHLVQFHFHSPSENELHGRAYPLEIHFVHQGDDGKLVVIGVFVQGGNANPVLQQIINNLPKDSGQEHEIANTNINPIDLLPMKKNYYSFMGSLTTPPCIEGVQWILMDDAITASPAQILQIRKAAGGANARPVQPLNHRTINFSMEKIQ